MSKRVRESDIDAAAAVNEDNVSSVEQLFHDIKRFKPIDPVIMGAARRVVKYRPLQRFINITQGDKLHAHMWVNLHRLYFMYITWAAYNTNEKILEFDEFKLGLIHLNIPVKIISSPLKCNANNEIEPPKYMYIAHIIVCEKVRSALKKLE